MSTGTSTAAVNHVPSGTSTDDGAISNDEVPQQEVQGSKLKRIDSLDLESSKCHQNNHHGSMVSPDILCSLFLSLDHNRTRS